MGDIETIGDGVLATHGAVVTILLFCRGLGGNRHAGDGVFLSKDGINGAGKSELHRASHLAAVDARGHDGAKGAHIVEILAHPVARLIHLVTTLAFLRIPFKQFFRPDSNIGAFMLLVQNGFFLDVDFIGRLLFLHQPNIVAHFALEADIGDQPFAGLCIDAWQVAGIRIAVGVAVLHIEQQYEIVAVCEAH